MTLYDNLNVSQNICIKNGKIKNVKSYEYFHNLVDGYYECKKKDAANADNSGCFNVWLDDASDLMTMGNTSDYYLSQVDYEDANLVNSYFSEDMNEMRDGGFWPFTDKGICGGQIVNKFTFFQPDNKIGVRIYANNVKRKFPLSKLE